MEASRCLRPSKRADPGRTRPRLVCLLHTDTLIYTNTCQTSSAIKLHRSRTRRKLLTNDNINIDSASVTQPRRLQNDLKLDVCQAECRRRQWQRHHSLHATLSPHPPLSVANQRLAPQAIFYLIYLFIHFSTSAITGKRCPNTHINIHGQLYISVFSVYSTGR